MLVLFINYSNIESDTNSNMDMFKRYTKVGDIT